jgi:hypothetical protein
LSGPKKEVLDYKIKRDNGKKNTMLSLLNAMEIVEKVRRV